MLQCGKEASVSEISIRKVVVAVVDNTVLRYRNIMVMLRIRFSVVYSNITERAWLLINNPFHFCVYINNVDLTSTIEKFQYVVNVIENVKSHDLRSILGLVLAYVLLLLQ